MLHSNLEDALMAGISSGGRPSIPGCSQDLVDARAIVRAAPGVNEHQAAGRIDHEVTTSLSDASAWLGHRLTLTPEGDVASKTGQIKDPPPR